jgi:arylsulfatase
MTPAAILRRIRVALGLTLLAAGVVAMRAAETRPNFVLIIGDDISAADLGCYGNPGIRTPNIDRVAREGLRFTNAYTTTSSCSPSRCSILTSRYPHNLETASELHGPLPPGLALFPQLLREAGYHTAQAGKAHFGEDADHVVGPALAAFDAHSDGERGDLQGGHGGENQWIARLRARPMNQPFFMWFASHDAHRIWDADSFEGMTRPDDVRVPPTLIDTPETRVDLAHYYDEIMRLDIFVGEVVRELARQNVLDRTVIIITADNGRPFPRSKTRLYDDGVKEPLIIRWPPSVPRDARTDALVSSIDLAPTILELAGLPRPATFQGVSLLPVLRDPRAEVRDFVFAEHNWHNFQAHVRMVRRGNFVYLRNAWPELPLPGASDTFYNPSADALKAAYAQGTLTPLQADVFRRPRPAEEFFDLTADPNEATNLAAAVHPPAELAHLRAALTQWTRETGDTVPTKPTPTNVIYETGVKTVEFWRGEPPGASAHALRINAPGPIRAGDVR